MNDLLTTVSAWWARFKWAVWIVLGLAGAVLLWSLRRLFSSTTPEEVQKYQPLAVPPAIQEQVHKAEEQALVTRVQASTQAEVHKEELQQIAQIPDGAERRKRLADMLRNLPQ